MCFFSRQAANGRLNALCTLWCPFPHSDHDNQFVPIPVAGPASPDYMDFYQTQTGGRRTMDRTAKCVCSNAQNMFDKYDRVGCLLYREGSPGRLRNHLFLLFAPFSHTVTLDLTKPSVVGECGWNNSCSSYFVACLLRGVRS